MRSHWESRVRDESGQTLLEAVVGFTILVLVIFAIEYGVTQTTAAGVVASQRSTETSLANQAIIQTEALPFADLQAGANPTNDANWVLTPVDPLHPTAPRSLVDWPQVTVSGGIYTLTLNPGGSNPVAVTSVTNGTAILATNTDPTTQAPPVVPFVSSTTLGKVKYKVAVFVTSVTNHPTLDLVRVTAIVERVLASSSNPTSTPCPNTPASPGASVTMCDAVVQQVELGSQ